jgi:hypothetical protein
MCRSSCSRILSITLQVVVVNPFWRLSEIVEQKITPKMLILGVIICLNLHANSLDRSGYFAGVPLGVVTLSVAA